MGVRYSRSTAVEAAPMQQETILFNSQTNSFCVLNPSAAVIWNGLEAPQDAVALASRVCQAFDGITEEQARRDVEHALKEFVSLSLIHVEN